MRPLHHLLSIATFLAATSVASAEAPLTLSGPAKLAPGEDFVITLSGCPGDIPVHMGSPTLGPTPFPKIGFLDIGSPTFITVLPPIPPSGVIELPCDVPCLTLNQPLPFHFQSIAARITQFGFDIVDKSNPYTITFDPSLTQDCNENGVPDSCEIDDGVELDCNGNRIPDSCEIKSGAETDHNGNGVLDSCESLRCPTTAVTDEFGGTSAHAVYLKSVTATLGVGPAFFLEDGASFMEYDDGTARLEGRIANFDDPDICFDMVVDFAGRVAPGDAAYPPSGSPKLELSSSAYASNGGPVDPSTWVYYTSTEGTLTGCGKLDGGSICFDRKGPAFQVGLGASGKNADDGASGWLSYEIKSQPSNPSYVLGDESNGGANDINIDLTSCPVLCPETAYADDTAVFSGKHAVYLASLVKPLGLDAAFVFDDGAAFSEDDDGTARLSGRIRNVTDPGVCFNLTVALGGRVDPSDASYPPDGSPKKELASSAYIENGGPVDPSTWRFYTTTTGALVGCDKAHGAEVLITRKGPAFQLGYGANGKNVEYGGSGWLSYAITSQPNNGSKLGDESEGGANDININLDDCK